jgi:hypothetical protein
VCGLITHLVAIFLLGKALLEFWFRDFQIDSRSPPTQPLDKAQASIGKGAAVIREGYRVSGIFQNQKPETVGTDWGCLPSSVAGLGSKQLGGSLSWVSN